MLVHHIHENMKTATRYDFGMAVTTEPSKKSNNLLWPGGVPQRYTQGAPKTGPANEISGQRKPS
jgi:hypothetical protein